MIKIWLYTHAESYSKRLWNLPVHVLVLHEHETQSEPSDIRKNPREWFRRLRAAVQWFMNSSWTILTPPLHYVGLWTLPRWVMNPQQHYWRATRIHYRTVVLLSCTKWIVSYINRCTVIIRAIRFISKFVLASAGLW